MNILIVDDDVFMLDTLEQTLEKLGHTAIRASGGEDAMEKLRKYDVRLAITDWDMPGMNGLEICRAIRGDEINGYVYLIMLTGRDDAKSRREGLYAGADDFLFKPLEHDDLLICLKTAERILALEMRDVALFALAKLAESRDPETGAHVERVQEYSRLLAQNLSPKIREVHHINAEFVRLLHQASALHDLGKVAISDAILLKPGKLTVEEFEIMKSHAMLGAKTLDAALERFPNAGFLRMARDIANSHHERFDGTGYPSGLIGEQIPISARIVALADVYDALTSRRVYKEPITHQQSRDFILASRGHCFDPDVVDAFVRAENQFISARPAIGNESNSSTNTSMSLMSSEARKSGFTILIVEDSITLQHELTTLLSATGHQLLMATNAQEGMRLFMAHLPEMVISDWEMPGDSGVELCRQVRNQSTGKSTYFIMLTAHSDQELLLEAFSVGANDFVAKPYNPQELLARVNAGLRVIELHKELRRKTEGLITTNSQLQVMNSRLDRLSVTDELTGLFNRRHAMVRLEEKWALAERYNRQLWVALIDIDHFKQVNDT